MNFLSSSLSSHRSLMIGLQASIGSHHLLSEPPPPPCCLFLIILWSPCRRKRELSATTTLTRCWMSRIIALSEQSKALLDILSATLVVSRSSGCSPINNWLVSVNLIDIRHFLCTPNWEGGWFWYSRHGSDTKSSADKGEGTVGASEYKLDTARQRFGRVPTGLSTRSPCTPFWIASRTSTLSRW